MIRRSAALLALTALLVPMALVGGPGRASAEATPTVSADVAAARPGDVVLVSLGGWRRFTTLTVVLCGNGGIRGSEDCDLVAGQAVEVRDEVVDVTELTITQPPMPCPCVLRAYDLTSSIVVTSPFEVIGAPVAPTVGRDPAAVIPLQVRASLTRVRGSFVDRLRRTLGGPVDHTLALVVRNTTGAALSDVVVTASVGRSAGRGSPLETAAPFDLAAGEERRLEVPVHLESLVRGTYVVSGSAVAGGVPTRFSTSTSSTPWGLVVLGVLALADLGVLLGVRRAKRQEQEPHDDLADDDDDPSDGDGGEPDDAWWTSSVSLEDDRQMTGANAW